MTGLEQFCMLVGLALILAATVVLASVPATGAGPYLIVGWGVLAAGLVTFVKSVRGTL